MTQHKDDTMQRLKSQLENDFKLSNPRFWTIVQSPRYADKWEAVKPIIDQAQRANSELEARRTVMEYEETQAIIKRRAQNAPPPMAGYLMQSLAYPQSPPEQAKWNIAARIMQEKRERNLQVQQQVFEALQHGEKHTKVQIQALQDTTDRIENEKLSKALKENIARNRQADLTVMARRLEAQIMESDEARARLNQVFNENRTKLIQQASAQGHEQPEQIVSEAFRAAQQVIDAHEHERLHTLFNTYGEQVQSYNLRQQAEAFIEEHHQNEATQSHDNSHERGQQEMAEKVRRVIDQGEKERSQLYDLLHQHRSQMIEIAQEKGAKNPEEAVSKTLSLTQDSISRKESQQLAVIFEDHDHSYTRGYERSEALDLLYRHEHGFEHQSEPGHEQGFAQDQAHDIEQEH